MRPPIEPAPTPWDFEAVRPSPDQDLVVAGADLAPGTLLAAYRHGMFPMGLGRGGRPPIGWWAPDPRGVLEPAAFRPSRSLRRSASRGQWRLALDTDVDAVLAGCADPGREGRWITRDIERAYRDLFDLGWVHTVEVWAGPELIGGLYGVSIGGLFCGESMFHRRTDASKAALWGLCSLLPTDCALIDVQWLTPHLATLGVSAIPRASYAARLPELLVAPNPLARWDEGDLDAPWRSTPPVPPGV